MSLTKMAVATAAVALFASSAMARDASSKANGDYTHWNQPRARITQSSSAPSQSNAVAAAPQQQRRYSYNPAQQQAPAAAAAPAAQAPAAQNQARTYVQPRSTRSFSYQPPLVMSPPSAGPRTSARPYLLQKTDVRKYNGW